MLGAGCWRSCACSVPRAESGSAWLRIPAAASSLPRSPLSSSSSDVAASSITSRSSSGRKRSPAAGRDPARRHVGVAAGQLLQRLLGPRADLVVLADEHERAPDVVEQRRGTVGGRGQKTELRASGLVVERLRCPRCRASRVLVVVVLPGPGQVVVLGALAPGGFGIGANDRAADQVTRDGSVALPPSRPRSAPGAPRPQVRCPLSAPPAVRSSLEHLPQRDDRRRGRSRRSSAAWPGRSGGSIRRCRRRSRGGPAARSPAGKTSTTPPRTQNSPCASTGSSRVKPASTSSAARS